MLNKIDNNCSFKANLETSLVVKNKTKLKNIKKLFNEDSKNYPKEKLYLTECDSGMLKLRTTLRNDNNEILIDSAQDFFKDNNEKDISKKLLNAFKVLRLTDISSTLKNSIDYNKTKFDSNSRIAKSLRKAGRHNFADKYELFATFNKNKIENLSKQLDNVKNTFLKQRETSSKQLPEVLQVEI